MNNFGLLGCQGSCYMLWKYKYYFVFVLYLTLVNSYFNEPGIPCSTGEKVNHQMTPPAFIQLFQSTPPPKPLTPHPNPNPNPDPSKPLSSWCIKNYSSMNLYFETCRHVMMRKPPHFPYLKLYLKQIKLRVYTSMKVANTL